MTAARRQFLAGGAASIAAMGLASCVKVPATLPAFDINARLRALEVESGGMLGAAIMNTATGTLSGNRLDERFAHCSSFKLSLAALAMKRAEESKDALDLPITISADDLTYYSPVTQKHVGKSMTIGELAKTTLTTSDNAAANILLRQFGGPEAMTAFWRSIGDDVSRLDRNEPSMNYVPPGEIRDTTTPRAMAQTVAKLIFGDVLSAPNRAALQQWMRETRTGMNRIRGGIPAEWDAGDKTGTGFSEGMGSIYVDLAFAVPPAGDPMVIAGYYKLAEVHSRVEPASAAVLAALGALAATSVDESHS